jgi:hypothetical protein
MLAGAKTPALPKREEWMGKANRIRVLDFRGNRTMGQNGMWTSQTQTFLIHRATNAS